MRHPNIISFVDSFEKGTRLYIVMDFADGGDLANKLTARRGQLLPEQQVVDWFVQLCLAMKHVHDRKILHRDLKTQNIFLTKNNMIKLGDFGIAKVLKNTRDLAKTQIGTPYYFSPEICEGKAYNNKSDVWSLGVVLYEMLTLKHPFDGRSMQQLVVKICRGNYQPISSRYSQDLKDLVKVMMSLRQGSRPSVNGVLKKKFIQVRISEFLEETVLQEEFSHTVLHGARGKFGAAGSKAPIPGIGQAARPAPSSRVAAAGARDVASRRAVAARPAARAAPAPRAAVGQGVAAPRVAAAAAAAKKSAASNPAVQKRGECGVCKAPVMTDQDRTQDDNGVYFHIECLQKERQAARQIDRQRSDDDAARSVAEDKAKADAAAQQRAADKAAASKARQAEQDERAAKERERQAQREQGLRDEREHARAASADKERADQERYQQKLHDHHAEFLARRKAGLANKRRIEEQLGRGGGGDAAMWLGNDGGGKAPPAARKPSAPAPAPAPRAPPSKAGGDDAEAARLAAVAEYNERARQTKLNRMRAEQDLDLQPEGSGSPPVEQPKLQPRSAPAAARKAAAPKKKPVPKAAKAASEEAFDMGATRVIKKAPKVNTAAQQREKLRDMIKKNKAAARNKGAKQAPKATDVPEDGPAAAVAAAPVAPASSSEEVEPAAAGLGAGGGAVDLAASIRNVLDAQMDDVEIVEDEDEEAEAEDEADEVVSPVEPGTGGVDKGEDGGSPIPVIDVEEEAPESAEDQDYEGYLMQLSLAASMRDGDLANAAPAASGEGVPGNIEEEGGDRNDSEFGDEAEDAPAAESVFARIERLRAELEADLGFDIFLAAFKELREVFSGENPPLSAPDDLKVKMKASFGEGKEECYSRLEELVKSEVGIFF
jgi:NIMA (never in mitosis gene a)-related kinase